MKTNQQWATETENALIDLGVRVIRMTEKLPKTYAGSHIGNQVLRSSTSCAPNFGEARAAESTADFIHKLKLVLKELNETQIWLKMIIRSELLNAKLIETLLEDTQFLSRQINASIRTSKANREQKTDK